MADLTGYVAINVGKYCKIDEVSSNLWYVGYLNSPNVLPTDKPFWAIQQIVRDGTGQVQVRWATNGTYSNIWDSRTTYFDTVALINEYSTDFDGVNDYVAADHSSLIASLNTEYTVSAWVKFNAFTARCIFSCSHSTTANVHKMFLGANASAKAVIEVRTDAGVTVSVTDTTTLSTGVWYHIVGVRSGTTLTVYVNGVANVSASGAINTTITNNVISIGAWRYGVTTTNYLSGRIDSVSVFNKALTSAEVLTIYAGGGAYDPTAHPQAAYLQAYYKMGDDDAFPTITDHTGNNYHGTMANMASNDFVTDVP